MLYETLICEVISLFTTIEISARSFNSPPDFQLEQLFLNFFFFASIAASTKDIEAPDFSFPPPVEIKKSISPFFPCASTCLLKKVLKPKSLDHAVTAAGKLGKRSLKKVFYFFF